MDIPDSSSPATDPVAALWDAVEQAWVEAGDPTPAEIEEASIRRDLPRLPKGTVDEWRRNKRVPDWGKFEVLIKCLGAEKKRDWKSLHVAAQAARNRRRKERGRSVTGGDPEQARDAGGSNIGDNEKPQWWNHSAVVVGVIALIVGVVIAISRGGSDGDSQSGDRGSAGSGSSKSQQSSTSGSEMLQPAGPPSYSGTGRPVGTMRIAHTMNKDGKAIGVCASKSSQTSIKGNCYDEGYLLNVVCRKPDGAERVDPNTQRRSTGWVKIDHNEWLSDLFLEPENSSARELQDLPVCPE